MAAADPDESVDNANAVGQDPQEVALDWRARDDHGVSRASLASG